MGAFFTSGYQTQKLSGGSDKLTTTRPTAQSLLSPDEPRFAFGFAQARCSAHLLPVPHPRPLPARGSRADRGLKNPVFTTKKDKCTKCRLFNINQQNQQRETTHEITILFLKQSFWVDFLLECGDMSPLWKAVLQPRTPKSAFPKAPVRL